ncbi:uncharacterized protein EAF01_002587 [Botrytis porri]|uniref:Uncharacterized protein n=1 Tax=Botrytis porri TaxID=87229 RepID=A0A4Z1KGB1_9HELO|nr:uncharacterized protein EAF01_002587 [Botrytis porri]KAF7911079.1 hypothetical protein EAF01_002587 [Botrytis porri]TGO83242.1 hypothetical protein BPOR_0678g00070 [Botrytis porri]
MNSKEKAKHDRSESARRNTLERMLELENRSKLQRMQASTATVSQPLRNSFFRERRPSNSNVYTNFPPEHPVPFRQSDRAMTAPTLSVAVPPAQIFDKPKTAPKTSKKVFVVEPVKEKSPQIVADVDADDSDASSICRSPAWDGGDGKQRRMAKKEAQDKRKKEEERLKKEKEKAERETRAAAQKQKGRLSKAPPANKRLSKTIPAVPVGRASSEPAVQVAPEIIKLSPDPDDGRRSRRTSLDLGLKKLMSSFRSRSRSTSISADATPRNQSTSSSPTSTGFIGGLKLQQSSEAATQNELRDGKSSNNRPASHSNKPSQSRPPISIENSRYRTLDLMAPFGTSTPAVELPTKSQSEDSYSPHTLKRPEASEQPASDLEPIMNRNPRARKPNENSRLDHVTESTVNHEANYKPQSPCAAPPSPGFRFGLENTPSSTQKVQEPLYSQGFNISPEDTNSENDDYFPTQKRHGKQCDLSSSTRDIKLDAAPIKEVMRRTPSIHNATGRSTSISWARENVEVVENEEDFRAFIDGESVPSDFRLTAQPSQSSIQPEEGMFSRRELQVPSFYPSPLSLQPKGAKNGTANVNHRYSSAPDSPSLQTSHLDEPLKKLRSQSTLSPRAAGFDSRSALPSQSARRVSEPEYSSPTFLSPLEINPVPQQKLPPQTANPTSPRRQKDRRSSSRSYTGSSEEYLSFDEQSSITTPAVSRPQSQKGPIASSHDTASRKYHKVKDSWNQTPIPVKIKDEEDIAYTLSGQATPTSQSANLHASLASADPNTDAGVADLQRRLSLSKSSSTTALQHTLNFLPELKHQPLRPRQGPGKRQSSEGKNVPGKGDVNGHGNGGKPRRESASTSAYAQYNDSKNSLMSSSALNGGESSNSNSNSSSSEKDNSNDSSQYLRSARLAIPPRNGPRMSNQLAASSAQSLHSNGQGGIEPMAKMFVICCGCNYFHDMPSKLYECMAKPEAVVKDEGLGVSGVVSTRVSCPWCGHGMSTKCCEGWAAVVVLKERMH